MNKEQIEILKDAIYQKRVKNQQLLNLQQKEIEQIQKEKEFCELAERAQLDCDAIKLLHLTGGVSDDELIKSKNHLNDLNMRLTEARENLRFIAQARSEINSEFGLNDLNITLYRNILCKELFEKFCEKMAVDKKLHEKLIEGYCVYTKNGSYDYSWGGFLLNCFRCPNNDEILLAESKLKAEHELLQD